MPRKYLEAQHLGEIGGPIFGGIEGAHLAIFERGAVNERSQGWQLGNQVHRVLVCVVPVGVLLHPLGIGLGKLALRLPSGVNSAWEGGYRWDGGLD